MNLQGSVPTMQQNNMTSLQQNSMSSISGVSTAQQNMMNSLQPSTNLDSGQGNALNSLQQVLVGSIQQTPVSAPQLANMNGLSSQSGEQQMLQNLLKQMYQQRMQQHVIQKQLQQQQQQQQPQQQLQQAKQQLPAQMQANQHQMPQLHQMNDANDLKMRQGMGVKPGVFQQHMSSGQRAYPHQQLKSGSPFPIPSSNQLLQAASPQISQHSPPQIKVMKEKYLPELSEIYQKIDTKLQQQLEKLKIFKTMLERLISILQVSKSNISPGLKDKLGLYEKHIVNFINTNRPRKQGPPLQQGQLPPPHM
ncbi:mediator of RNA polymerase II transcription subunit 15a-like [Pyrus ussuriensis x Pyrus communis]|uniref:Mediator of RNA polymerase II transcription subunit 15a-like n=1 Tax=Pyrus ussuriensis x Pyrus communis TaxID=2448454 RepID=A0A5N5GNE9_9ROSA|nr:mediator of RNA polymerase II transcription subunit 15a-like [Pyrus ussuriensis x Pyrus communis]